MEFWKSNRKISLVLILILGVILWFYYQSSVLRKQADDLLKFGKPEEAIEVYKKALQMFPIRGDIKEDIEGAKLILESSRTYGRIVQFEELQEIPPLSSLPSIPLNPNELFVPVLMYHHIRTNPNPSDPVSAALNVTPSQLNEQLSYLSSHNYHTITLSDLSDALDGKISLPENPIILTFDDGYRNFYDNAYPLLKKYNMKAVQFVVTGVLNISSYLTWNQIEEMDKSGLVEFGAHTRHHANLPEFSQKAIVDEIRGSKIDLENHLKKPVSWFAYPYGSYSDFIMRIVKNAGFKGAASTVYGAVQSKDNAYLSPRIMVDGRFSLENMVMRIQR